MLLREVKSAIKRIDEILVLIRKRNKTIRILRQILNNFHYLHKKDVISAYFILRNLYDYPRLRQHLKRVKIQLIKNYNINTNE
jgi:hypothetical protein